MNTSELIKKKVTMLNSIQYEKILLNFILKHKLKNNFNILIMQQYFTALN